MTDEEKPDPIRETDTFITKLSKSPLWVFGWGLFLTSLTFIAGVFLDLNEQNAHIAKFNSLSHRYEMDGRRTDGTTKTMHLVWNAAIDATRYFAENIEDKEPESVPENVLEKGLQLIGTGRSGINAELSLLSSLHFNDSELSRLVDGFQDDLEALDGFLEKTESISRHLEEKKYVEARNELSDFKNLGYRRVRQLNAGLIRVSAFESAAQLKDEEYKAELQLQQARLKSFNLKVYLILPVSGIVGLFAVVLIRKFRRAVVKEGV